MNRIYCIKKKKKKGKQKTSIQHMLVLKIID